MELSEGEDHFISQAADLAPYFMTDLNKNQQHVTNGSVLESAHFYFRLNEGFDVPLPLVGDPE